MNDRDWLIWYRNWLCHEHQPAVLPTTRVVDAIDDQLGVSGVRAADQKLADAGRPRHAGSCGNQNAMHPDGVYTGVEDCGCNHPALPLIPLRWTPQPPQRAHADFCRLDTDHKGPCGLSRVVVRHGGGPYLTSKDVWHVKDASEPPQAFWRCKHYPIATHNWHDDLVRCRFGCDNEPTWDSNGMRT